MSDRDDMVKRYDEFMDLEAITDLSQKQKRQPNKLRGTVADYTPTAIERTGSHYHTQAWRAHVNIDFMLKGGDRVELRSSYLGQGGQRPYRELCEFLSELKRNHDAVEAVTYFRGSPNIVQMIGANDQYFVKGIIGYPLTKMRPSVI